MSPRANVRSLDSIRHFRPAIYTFEDELKSALGALRQEINRSLQWLDHDCPAYWQNQVRKGFDRVAQARTELARKSMITVAGHRADCIDEKKALANAKRNLEIAQEKIQTVRQWSVKVHRVADEYSSRISRAEQLLNQGVPRIKGLLERIILSLESYVEMSAAASDAIAPGASVMVSDVEESSVVEQTAPDAAPGSSPTGDGASLRARASETPSETTS